MPPCLLTSPAASISRFSAARANKTLLLSLCDLRAAAERLLGYSVRLRCEDPAKGTRAQALAYQGKQIVKLGTLAEVSGLAVLDAEGAATGYTDPADPFAANVLDMLREDLAELHAGPYPVPLPDGCELTPAANFDAFAAGRLYNGKVR